MTTERAAAPVVVKFGGELLDNPEWLRAIVSGLVNMARAGLPLVVVHGGGKAIDAALKSAGVEKQQVDGLRVTDEPTLDVVVAVLAGSINTRLVAALTVAGVNAVGLTGADAGCGRADVAAAHQAVDGRTIDLGRVGTPSNRSDVRLLTTLVGAGFVPVVASIGLAPDGRLLNVNADTFAGAMAAQLGAERLVVAGTTAGVLDEAGQPVPELDQAAVERIISAGTASAGMVAKLRACEQAVIGGVDAVVIVDGRDGNLLEAAALGRSAVGTRVRAAASAAGTVGAGSGSSAPGWRKDAR